MDMFAVAVGFITGAFTSAAGSYLADKYTDRRREKRYVREQKKLWEDIEARFPAVIAEMRADFSRPEASGVRAFFLKASNTSIGFTSEPCFEYHTDKHPDVHAAVLHLARHGFVSDITPGNCPMFRVHEQLVDRLLGLNRSINSGSPMGP
jgi:hypothetical protein